MADEHKLQGVTPPIGKLKGVKALGVGEGAEEERGKLNQDQVAHVIAWVNDKRKGDEPLVCSICDNHTWTLPNLMGFIGGHLHPWGTGGQGYPVVPLVCSNCGQMLFFSAVSLGLVQGDQEKGSG